jgi:tRNA (guanine37-N1)-methyltransferase
MDKPLFSVIAITLFPGMFPGPLGLSLAGKALEKGIWSLNILDLRDFATDKHATVDDSPYGGGIGMVLKPDVVDRAVTHAKSLLPAAKVIYPSPRGPIINQNWAETHKNQYLIILCGRFEGLDQRVIDHHNMEEVSLGDFILSGGEIAALAMLDACVRLLPGVIGNHGAHDQESFAPASKYAGLLEYPHYTRPSVWNGNTVPEVLLSGNHEQIDAWRLEQAKAITASRRPDLLEQPARREKIGKKED